MELTVKKAKLWMEALNEKIQKHKEYLSELDQAIGDGDHGVNMARGFQEVMNKLSDADYATPSDLLKDVAMVLMSKVGGASGPLYGTAFLKMAMATKNKEKLTEEDLTLAVEEAIKGLEQRGKAQLKDKTMLDVWIPVHHYMKQNSPIGWENLEATAKGAMEATKELLALKGRAAYLKERSVGHIDPGSVSSYYLFQTLAETMKEGDE
ncbi:dihydroxyacetone kinase subunit DhaL [Caldibacillus thermoamylovorans]|uniref:dihydroxyacetone kinase subunit DhaL n=2 Tax=Bacillales TaxID=1385 RepID=UPI00203AE587|nr:dihydroxyacetone kinase subunit DhaL [Caldibacillus thermoamylovorans]MCM3478702.1 dihydroxyacetone kinase subunit DhaL [Caldibacillus thermoamylovorans]